MYQDASNKKFDIVLTEVESKELLLPSDEIDKKEAVKTFKRLIVQLDSERKTNAISDIG